MKGIQYVIAITSFLFLGSFAQAQPIVSPIDYGQLVQLPNSDQIQVVKMLWRFYIDLEFKQIPGPLEKKTSQIELNFLNQLLPSAYADPPNPIAFNNSQTCVYGGWVSVMDPSTSANNPNRVCKHPKYVAAIVEQAQRLRTRLERREQQRQAQEVNLRRRMTGTNSEQRIQRAMNAWDRNHPLPGPENLRELASSQATLQYLTDETIRYYPASGRGSGNKFTLLRITGNTEINPASIRQDQNSCPRDYIICNPAIFGSNPTNNNLFCVVGDGESHNTSMSCARAVEYIGDEQAGDPTTDQIVNTVLNRAANPPNALAHNLLTMYDMCMCNGARTVNRENCEGMNDGDMNDHFVSASGRCYSISTTSPQISSQYRQPRIINQSYTSRMFYERTCYGILLQTDRILRRIEANPACLEQFRQYHYQGSARLVDFINKAIDAACREFNDIAGTPIPTEAASCERPDEASITQLFSEQVDPNPRRRRRARQNTNRDEQFIPQRRESLLGSLKNRLCPIEFPLRITSQVLEDGCGEFQRRIVANLEGLEGVDGSEEGFNWTFTVRGQQVTTREGRRNEVCIPQSVSDEEVIINVVPPGGEEVDQVTQVVPPIECPSNIAIGAGALSNDGQSMTYPVQGITDNIAVEISASQNYSYANSRITTQLPVNAADTLSVGIAVIINGHRLENCPNLQLNRPQRGQTSCTLSVALGDPAFSNQRVPGSDSEYMLNITSELNPLGFGETGFQTLYAIVYNTQGGAPTEPTSFTLASAPAHVQSGSYLFAQVTEQGKPTAVCQSDLIRGPGATPTRCSIEVAAIEEIASEEDETPSEETQQESAEKRYSVTVDLGDYSTSSRRRLTFNLTPPDTETAIEIETPTFSDVEGSETQKRFELSALPGSTIRLNLTGDPALESTSCQGSIPVEPEPERVPEPTPPADETPTLTVNRTNTGDGEAIYEAEITGRCIVNGREIELVHDNIQWRVIEPAGRQSTRPEETPRTQTGRFDDIEDNSEEERESSSASAENSGRRFSLPILDYQRRVEASINCGDNEITADANVPRKNTSRPIIQSNPQLPMPQMPSIPGFSGGGLIRTR